VSTITYRSLDISELDRFEEIDRAEVTDHIYYLRQGQLVLEEEHWELNGWPQGDLPGIKGKLHTCLDEGGAAWGAFDGDRLVGIAALDGRWYRSARDTLDLYFLHVSNDCRHNGIGRTLVEMTKERAREMGAKRLFVSGLPSLNTIRFYQAMGFDIAQDVDPRLFEREPEDIHMDMGL
jgi:GNAT superfamily N-acetyltransferase